MGMPHLRGSGETYKRPSSFSMSDSLGGLVVTQEGIKIVFERVDELGQVLQRGIWVNIDRQTRSL